MYFSPAAVATFFATVVEIIAPAKAHGGESVVSGLKENIKFQDFPISVTYKSLEPTEITPRQISNVKDALTNSCKMPHNSEQDDIILQETVVKKAFKGPLPDEILKLEIHDPDAPVSKWTGYQYNYELSTSCGCKLCSNESGSAIEGCGCKSCKDGTQNGCDCEHCQNEEGSDCDCHHCNDQKAEVGCKCNLCNRFMTDGRKNALHLQWERQFCNALIYQEDQLGVFDCRIDLACNGRVDGNVATDVDIKK